MKPTSFRFSEMTSRQMARLVESTGHTRGEIVAIAIDRMYQQELSMNTQTITVETIDTKPRHDPYTNIAGVASRTTLKLDPRDRTCWVTQEYNDNSTPMNEWNHLVLTWRVPDYPSEDAMREWINDHLDALTTICDGFEDRWDGNNRVGRYTDDARAAAEAIAFELDNGVGPANYYEFWTVESWLESSRNEITAEMTDAQLTDLADQWTPVGDIIVDGSILDFITEIRDTLRFEQEISEA